MDISQILWFSLGIGMVGCLMHFVFEWTHRKAWAAVFGAVNESTWEHIKIGLTGFFVATIFDYFMFGEMPNYWIAKGLSMGAFVVLIPLLFYGFKRFLGKAILVIDIIEFFLAVVLAECVFAELLNGPKLVDWLFYVAFVIIFLLLWGYILFTWMPPKNFLFVDPRNGKYGLEAGENHHHRHHHRHGEVRGESDKEILRRIGENVRKNGKKIQVKDGNELAKKRIAAAKKARNGKKRVI